MRNRRSSKFLLEFSLCILFHFLKLLWIFSYWFNLLENFMELFFLFTIICIANKIIIVCLYEVSKQNYLTYLLWVHSFGFINIRIERLLFIKVIEILCVSWIFQFRSVWWVSFSDILPINSFKKSMTLDLSNSSFS